MKRDFQPSQNCTAVTKEASPPAAQELRRNRQRKERCKADDNFLITVPFFGSFSLLFTVWFAVTKEADFMPKRRANGEGNIRKRKDGRWEGRYTTEHAPGTDKAIYRDVLGRIQEENKVELKQVIEQEKTVD